MHLLIPFASTLSDDATAMLRDLSLPNLARLISRSAPPRHDDGDAESLSPPHERAFAAAAGWHGADGCLPFAAHAAAKDRIAVGDLAWGLVTPVHWHVGSDLVTLADPAALNLTEVESRAAFGAVHALFDTEGLRFEWGAASRWYVAHDGLAELPCASLDRVIGRNVDRWMLGNTAATPQSRLIRRLQSEVQLLLYPHALNEAREQRGELTLNSFWLSGCGLFQPEAGATPEVADALREPALRADWAEWIRAWQALDASALALALDAAERGDAVSLTLCGERSAHRYDSGTPKLWQRLTARWNTPAPHAVLESL